MKSNVLVRSVRAPAPEDALDFILYEHLQHREMCRVLDQLAAAQSFDAQALTRMADFIRVDLTLHIRDEEEHLFPLLRRRCDPEDQVDVALERFDREHEDDRGLSAEVRRFLNTAIVERRPVSQIAGAPEALRAFAQSQRRHMMLENAVLIPLARRRLTKDDVAALGKRLAAGRRESASSS